MEWDLRTPSWDLTYLERDEEPSIGSVVGMADLGGAMSKGDCSVDLQLGRLGDFSDPPLDKWKDTRVAETVSPSGSSKRIRGTNNGSQTVSCLVDGCKSDLSNCREYHKRHKVCEVHAKTPEVMVGGREQRFCQQCSRFHSLKEFDEAKRSCRKRLDGHNRRRRKLQPDPLPASSAIMFGNHHQGSSFSSFPQVLSTTLPNPGWPAPFKSQEGTLYTRHPPVRSHDRQHLFPVSLLYSHKTSRNFPFDGAPFEISACQQPLLNTVPLDSDCALSLLSSPNQTSGLGLSQMVQADRMPMAQPFTPGLQFSTSNNNQSLGRYSCSQASNHVSSTGISSSGMEDEQVGTTILFSNGEDADLHCQEIFHVEGNATTELADNGTSQTLPIFWHS